jgi:hypothetical protein
MTALIEIPLGVYQELLGRCVLSSREYAVLKNSVVSRSPIYLRFRNVVESLCELDDAKLLLNRAKLFYPAAVSWAHYDSCECSRTLAPGAFISFL